MRAWMDGCAAVFLIPHSIAFFLGFLLDLLLGDPQGLPHPVRLIGALIARTEHVLRRICFVHEQQKNPARKNKRELAAGALLVVFVLLVTGSVTALLLYGAYRVHMLVGLAVEAVLTYQLFAAKCLCVESMKVYECLRQGKLADARAAVSMIVGRDTACLDETGVAKAAIETVAENTSDGVIAPMLYTALGGPVLGICYKAVNTMDSMLGYKNEAYLYFGRAAARLDDLWNYVPARISAHLMLAAAYIGGDCFSGKDAYRIYRRDRRKHASPNAAQTESVCAGALGIALAGDAVYFGKAVQKPLLGDAKRAVVYEDIRRANRLMYVTAWLCALCCLVLFGAALW